MFQDTKADSNKMDADQLHMSESESMSTSLCRLFTLPAELRNRIYEYALTATDDIFPQSEPYLNLDTIEDPPHNFQLSHWTQRKPHNGFNQLRFTCRFLYRETCALELKFNIIRLNLSEIMRIGPAERLPTFLASCCPRKAGWIRTLELNNDAMTHKGCTIEEPRHFLAVTDFCRQNPLVTVRYVPNQMSPDWYSVQNVLELGVMINLVVRGKDLRWVVSPAAEFTFEDGYLRRWLDEWDVAAKLNAPNLRFWPLHGLMEFDEKSLTERLVRQGSLVVDACVKLVKEWREVGI